MYYIVKLNSVVSKLISSTGVDATVSLCPSTLGEKKSFAASTMSWRWGRGSVASAAV